MSLRISSHCSGPLRRVPDHPGVALAEGQACPLWRLTALSRSALKQVGGRNESPPVQPRVPSPGGLACWNDGACAVSDREDAGAYACDSEAERGIVETEAYPPGDAAGHAFRGKTRGNQSLFLGPGYCYVYFTYGSSFMVNVTSEELGDRCGVLLRALEPLEGIEIMQRIRKVTRTRDIARGPGRLAQAMQIDKRYDGVDLCAGEALWLGTAARRIGPICSSPRIGLTREVDRKRRFRVRQSLRQRAEAAQNLMKEARCRPEKSRLDEDTVLLSEPTF